MTSPGTLKTAYPFIKHIPAALAKAKAQAAAARRFAGRKQRDTTEKRNVGLWFVLPSKERETAGCQYRMAPGTAMTSSRDNDTPVQPNVRALKRHFAVIRRRQWGRLRENHARGEIPRGAGKPPAV